MRINLASVCCVGFWIALNVTSTYCWCQTALVPPPSFVQNSSVSQPASIPLPAMLPSVAGNNSVAPAPPANSPVATAEVPSLPAPIQNTPAAPNNNFAATPPSSQPAPSFKAATSPAPAPNLQAGKSLSSITRNGARGLDASVGQYWATYDLRPYTQQLAGYPRPEQAIVDWIIRETGTDIWFHEPMGVLSANRETLSVYHNEGVHNIVKGVYEKFVNGNTQPQNFTIRLLTAGSPEWRQTTLAWMRSVDVNSPGIQGWLLNKEQTALLIATLRGRGDLTEIATPKIAMHNGQLQRLESMRMVSYVRGYERRELPQVSYVPISDSINEGYRIELSPLMSIDERSIDMTLSCKIDQVERLNSVAVDLPTPTGALQSVKVSIPQMMSWRFEERFYWPADQTLVLSCGVVAPPAANTRATILNSGDKTGFLGIGKLIPTPPSNRADALLMIEYSGTSPTSANQPANPPQSSPINTATNPISRGRY